MSLIEKLYDNVEATFAWVSSALQQNALSYCELETADSSTVLVGDDGSLVSIIRLNGFKRFVGANEFAFLTQRLSDILQPVFSTNGHFLQFYFSYDSSDISYSLEKSLVPARKTAKRLNLNIDDIFDSRVKTLEKFCAEEDCFIVLWTTPESIESTHRKSVVKSERAKIKSYKLPDISKTQNLFAVLPELRNMHQSFVDTVVEDIQHTGFYADLLEVHEAVREVRRSVDPDFTDRTWQPSLPGDLLPKRFKATGKFDFSDIMWPPLSEQIIPRDGENVSLKIARVGSRIYAPLFIELFPKEIKPFYDLFRRMINADMPWRMSYFFAPDGISITKSKNMLAQFLTFSSYHNKLISEAHNLLKSMDERSDDPIIKLFVCFATWAPDNKHDLLKARVAKLVKTVQSWGGCEIRQVSGDAYGSTMSSTMGMTKTITATATAAPLSHAVSMLPFVRPASPWKHGALLFRTPDGKLWPYQPGSAHQVSWIDIIYARSGSGKSVLLNTLNLGLCLSSGLSKLPRVAIIDIGPSSKGFISLLQGGLPEEQRHEAMYYRLSMDDKDSINPFDTQVGARHPTRIHRSFLINFISLLLVDNVEDRPYEGMSSMLSMLIDETFNRFSDSEQPKIFVPGSEAGVDQGVAEIGFKYDHHSTWWNVSDALFVAGHPVWALKAQRRAMPSIADTISIAHVNSIKDLFSKVKTPTGEDYVTSYCRIISGVIRNFPTLTSYTRLSLEGARVVALDLDEVAKSGSGAADKQTAIMYMLARHILSKDFFINAEEVDKFPEEYRSFHRSRIKEIMEEPKRMVFDEFHRTSKSPVVRDQVVQDMREGRKWKIHISLTSQSLRDFDPIMVEFATSIFILDSGSAGSIDETCKTFGLTETEKVALSTRVHGPTSTGSTFVAQFVTKKGMNTQLLTSTISPVELWAFNTTTEDVHIRDSLYELIGPVAARGLLAKQFPKGSAVSDIEMEVRTDPTATIAQVCERFIKDLVHKFKRSQQLSSFEDF